MHVRFARGVMRLPHNNSSDSSDEDDVSMAVATVTADVSNSVVDLPSSSSSDTKRLASLVQIVCGVYIVCAGGGRGGTSCWDSTDDCDGGSGWDSTDDCDAGSGCANVRGKSGCTKSG